MTEQERALLVVTADDVGLHPGMTDGAIAAHDSGIVTACSVVAGGPDLERAASLLRARPALGAGLHLVLAGGPLVSDPADVPTLAPRGLPLADHRAFLVRLALGRIDLRDVEREARSQVERARAAGLRIGHIDGHQHLHVAPGVLDVVIRVARDLGIGYVRVPLERALPVTPRALAIAALGALAARARPRLRAAGIATNDRAIGLVGAGRHTGGRLRGLLRKVDGVTELVAHPGSGSARIAADHPWGYDWDGEREALCAPGLRDEIEALGIRLVRPDEVRTAS